MKKLVCLARCAVLSEGMSALVFKRSWDEVKRLEGGEEALNVMEGLAGRYTVKLGEEDSFAWVEDEKGRKVKTGYHLLSEEERRKKMNRKPVEKAKYLHNTFSGYFDDISLLGRVMLMCGIGSCFSG